MTETKTYDEIFQQILLSLIHCWLNIVGRLRQFYWFSAIWNFTLLGEGCSDSADWTCCPLWLFQRCLDSQCCDQVPLECGLGCTDLCGCLQLPYPLWFFKDKIITETINTGCNQSLCQHLVRLKLNQAFELLHCQLLTLFCSISSCQLFKDSSQIEEMLRGSSFL